VSSPDATVTFHPRFVIGSVDSRLVGSCVEHLGRCVYTGLYEAGDSMADDAGFRTDVAELPVNSASIWFLGWAKCRSVQPMLARPWRVD
jgi:alpha-L-arabinofuranosidase